MHQPTSVQIYLGRREAVWKNGTVWLCVLAFYNFLTCLFSIAKKYNELFGKEKKKKEEKKKEDKKQTPKKEAPAKKPESDQEEDEAPRASKFVDPYLDLPKRLSYCMDITVIFCM